MRCGRTEARWAVGGRGACEASTYGTPQCGESGSRNAKHRFVPEAHSSESRAGREKDGQRRKAKRDTHKPGASSILIFRRRNISFTVGSCHKACISSAQLAMISVASSSLSPSPVPLVLPLPPPPSSGPLSL